MVKNAIVVCSGGLDSGIVSYYVKKKINPESLLLLFFDYGQRTLKEEKYCVEVISKSLGAELKVIDMKWLGDISAALLNSNEETPVTTVEDLGDVEKEKEARKLWWVPCRNSLFLLSALAHAESIFLNTGERPVIYSGIKKEGKVPMKDTTPIFLKKINELGQEATYHGKYKIEAPLMEMDKDAVVKLGSELGVPFENTYSCFTGCGFRDEIPVHCGTCSNCKLRQTGFYWSDVKDTSVYLK